MKTVLPGHTPHLVLHGADKHVHRGTRHKLRGNRLDFTRPRGAEEQRLPLAGNACNDSLDLRGEFVDAGG